MVTSSVLFVETEWKNPNLELNHPGSPQPASSVRLSGVAKYLGGLEFLLFLIWFVLIWKC